MMRRDKWITYARTVAYAMQTMRPNANRMHSPTYANQLDNNEKSHPYARMHGFRGGRDVEQIDLEDCIAAAPADPYADYPDIPEGLDRRAKRGCQACDGMGCPTCQPRRFGIGGI